MTNEKHTDERWEALEDTVFDANGARICQVDDHRMWPERTAALIARAPSLLAENEELRAVIAREQKLTTKAMNENARLRDALEAIAAVTWAGSCVDAAADDMVEIARRALSQ